MLRNGVHFKRSLLNLPNHTQSAVLSKYCQSPVSIPSSLCRTNLTHPSSDDVPTLEELVPNFRPFIIRAKLTHSMQPSNPLQMQSADDVIRIILEHLQRRPYMETVAAFLSELDKTRPQPFRQCFASKSRLMRLIMQAPNQEYVLVMLPFARIDLMPLRPYIDQRIPPSYLFLKPQMQQMQQIQDPTKRQNLAQRNLYKIELLFRNIVFRCKVEPQANMLLNFIALIPGDLNHNQHVELFGELVNRIVGQEQNVDLDYLFELVALEFSGSGGMAAVLSKHSVKAGVLADKLIQFCQQKGRELSRMLKTLVKNYKRVKFYDMCCELPAKLQQRPDQLVELFRNFVKSQLLKDMARDMLYCDGERVVRAMMRDQKVNYTGTLSGDEFNWLVTNINKNYLCQHLVLLQLLAKRCLPTNMVDQYYTYLEKYLEPHQKQQQQQQQQQYFAKTMQDLGGSNSNLFGAASSKNLYTTQGDLNSPTPTSNKKVQFAEPYGLQKPVLGKPFNPQQPQLPKKEMYPKSSKELLNPRAIKPTTPMQPKTPNNEPTSLSSVCTEYIGIPNVGNSCYLNSFFIALHFCRQFVGLFFNTTPKDISLQYLRNLLIYIYQKQKKELLGTVNGLKKTLPEEFSSSVQQDTMEFGRFILDKIVEINSDFKKMFEIRIEETIMCPKGDIIDKKVVSEYSLMLSFEDPKLFSKLESKVGEIDLNSMISRDYFTSTIIEGDFQCEVCKCKYNKREKSQRILALPNILIVALSRFTYDLGRSAKRKICDRVRIDNWLLFGPITEPNKPDNFQLVSFINHMGKTADSGHYQSYVRYPKQENRWLDFNDDFVTECYQGRIVDLVRGMNQFDTPYVLFYEKKQ